MNSNIYKNLWQGEKPDDFEDFDIYVFCAFEYQRKCEKEVIRVYLDDCTITPDIIKQASSAAKALAKKLWLYPEKLALVSCWAGINRSSLVTALTLHYWLGFSGEVAYQLIKRQRPQTFSNASFAEYVRQIPRTQGLTEVEWRIV